MIDNTPHSPSRVSLWATAARSTRATVVKRTAILVVLAGLGGGVVAAPPGVGSLKVTYSEASGIGPEKGVMRRDPSDII